MRVAFIENNIKSCHSIAAWRYGSIAEHSCKFSRIPNITINIDDKN